MNETLTGGPLPLTTAAHSGRSVGGSWGVRAVAGASARVMETIPKAAAAGAARAGRKGVGRAGQ